MYCICVCNTLNEHLQLKSEKIKKQNTNKLTIEQMNKLTPFYKIKIPTATYIHVSVFRECLLVNPLASGDYHGNFRAFI